MKSSSSSLSPLLAAFAFLLFGVSSSANETGNPPCYNDDSTGGCRGGGCQSGQSGSSMESTENDENIADGACETEGNPFGVYSGNVVRNIDDLVLWNTPGDLNFRWSRVGKSRLVQGASSYFGTAHQWFHNWDSRLFDDGISPVTGGRLINVRYPSGHVTNFREGSDESWSPINANWRGQDRLFEKSLDDGDAFDGFDVLMESGLTLRFVQKDDGNGSYYRLEEVLDKYQNVYTLEYEAQTVDRLLKVTAPGGAHSFHITWGTTNGLDVIESVSTSDGRSVDYDYRQITDPVDDSLTQALFHAHYSDGTFGYYRYNWERNSFRRPLLGVARDPRVRSGARIVRYNYNPVFYGMVKSERNPLDNSVLVSRAVDNDSGVLSLSYGNNSTRMVLAPLGAGRLSENFTRIGGQKSITYGGFLNRSLRSTSDTNGQTVTYQTRSGDFLRPTRVLYEEEGGAQYTKRYGYTRTGLMLRSVIEPSEGGSFVTDYTRNANDGSLERVDHPDGTSESWLRNEFSDPLEHTHRNGAVERWTYYPEGPFAGLVQTHTPPVKPGEVAASEEMTYYPNGLLHVHTLDTGGQLTYQYDEIGQVTRQSYDDGSFITKDYTGTVLTTFDNQAQRFNDLTSTQKFEGPSDQNPDGYLCTYDEFGRKLTQTDALGNTTTYDYGDAGQGICNTCTTRNSPLRMISPEGRVTRYFYDEEWRQLLSAPVADGDGGGDDYDQAVASLYGPEGRLLYRVSNIAMDNVDLDNMNLSDPISFLPFLKDASWMEYHYDLRGRKVGTTVYDGGIPALVKGVPTGGTAIGYETSYELDGIGNTIQVTAPGNRVVRMSYAGGNAIMRQMTSQTQVVQDSSGGFRDVVTNYSWVNGERIAMQDNIGRVTSMSYDGRRNPLLTTFPDSSTIARSYYTNGLLQHTFDEEGRQALCQYDTYGRKVSYAAPNKAPSITVFRPLALGGVSQVTDSTGLSMAYGYDDDSRRISMTRAPGTADAATSSYQYDGDDLLVRTTDAVGMITSIDYDSLRRRTSVTVPGSNVNDLLTTTTSYFTAQDQVITTYPDGTTSIADYDDLGRMAASTNENNETIAYTYQEETSWMTTLTDARGKVTSWTYNDLGQMRTKTYPGTPVEVDSYTYDDVQRMHTHTRPSQKRATYGYDERDRATSVTWDSIGGASLYGSGEDQTFTYFIDGRPQSRSNGLSAMSYQYYPSGDLLSETQAHNGNSWLVGYDHDDAGRLTDLTYPAVAGLSEEVAYDYNTRGELTQVYNPDDGQSVALATYERRSDSLISRLTYDNHSSGNGSQTRYYYDTGKRSTGRYHHNPNGGFQDKNQYGYDNRSRRIWQEWRGNTGDRYGYDPTGRVTTVDHGVTNPEGASGALIADQSFAYDDMGNRESFTVTNGGTSANILAGSNSYIANDKNQYSTITSPSTPPQGNWSYDLDGNLIDDGTRIFTWDAWNRLREVQLKGTSQPLATYSYDANGRRIAKTSFPDSGPATTAFIYDGWNVIQEWNNSDSSSATGLELHAYLVWGEDLSGSMQGAGGVGGLLMRAASDGIAYFHYDANGNPARLARSNGGWQGRYRYDAFGNVRDIGGTLAGNNPWRFSTKYSDEETGLSYYGYRYYDPVTGRWPSRDPLGERGGINLYGFGPNSPMNGVDVKGQVWHILGGAVVGAVIGGVSAAVTGGDIGQGALSGAVGGAVTAATGIPALGGAAAGAVGGAFSGLENGGNAANAIGGAITGAALGGALGGAGGALSSRVGGAFGNGLDIGLSGFLGSAAGNAVGAFHGMGANADFGNNGNGEDVPDNRNDLDGDGIDDEMDGDADGDGIPDWRDAVCDFHNFVFGPDGNPVCCLPPGFN